MEQRRLKPLRIAYLTHRSERDTTYWSGIPSRTVRYLRERGHDVKVFVFDKRPLKAILTPIEIGYRILGREWMPERSPLFDAMLKAWMKTRSFEGFDALICESSMLAAACPDKSPPVYFWVDAEIQSYAESYWSDSRRARIVNLEEAVRQEQRAIDQSTRVLYASQWAIDEVRARYNIASPEKLVLAPFFDNLPTAPSQEDAYALANRRSSGQLKLLFIGVDWERKGGPRVLDLLRRIREKDVDAQLTIVGAKPFGDEADPQGVTTLGFLDKSDPDEALRFQEL